MALAEEFIHLGSDESDTMLLKASDPYSLHNPSTCERRVYLRHQGEPEEPPGPYEQVLRALGDRHEKSHLGKFQEVVDLARRIRLRENKEPLRKSRKKPLSFIKVDSGRRHGLRAWIVKS